MLLKITDGSLAVFNPAGVKMGFHHPIFCVISRSKAAGRCSNSALNTHKYPQVPTSCRKDYGIREISFSFTPGLN
jgi:hypothetical protein